MAVAGCINAYDCAGCYLTTLQQLQSDNIGVAINYTAPGEYGRRQLDYIKYTDKCGCTCCLTGENELRIVATQGVIKNFTLTNDDTNEVVNVKWNDLFGSNRAYTMVRYKTGSYPTSITDGTLAVKETTQNQYSVSGYNVSGLTDLTTYYFTAFAVSQDGTIIVVQNKNITTAFYRGKFQKVEFIQNTSTSRIDTGLKSGIGYKIDLKFYTVSSNIADQTVVGGITNTSQEAIYRGINYGSSYRSIYRGYNSTRFDANNTMYVGNTYTGTSIIRNGTQQLILNGNTIQSGTLSLSGTGTSNMSIFSRRGTYFALIKLYYMKIYDSSNNLIRDFIPAYRKSDSVIGLVDAVNKVFYTNAGGGTFTKGPDVN